jgi:hypothetical protein
MPPHSKAVLPAHLELLLPTLPVNVTRKAAADIITRHVFPVSHRSLERWPLLIRRVNGKATTGTAGALAEAWARFNAAPELMSGRSTAMQPTEVDFSSNATSRRSALDRV